MHHRDFLAPEDSLHLVIYEINVVGALFFILQRSFCLDVLRLNVCTDLDLACDKNTFWELVENLFEVVALSGHFIPLGEYHLAVPQDASNHEQANPRVHNVQENQSCQDRLYLEMEVQSNC